MWYKVNFNALNIEYETEKATLIKMPRNSNYDGYCFWHPKKLVRENAIGKGYFLTFSFDETFKFKLQKFSNSKFKKELLDEVILDFEEIKNEFEVGNETIEEIEKQVKENEIITYEIIKPEKIEDKEVIIDSELIV
jgi:hypothetical protein